MIPAPTAEQFAAAQMERQWRTAADPIEDRLWRAKRDYIKALGNSPLRQKYPSLPLFLRAVESAIAVNGGNEFTGHY